MNVHCLTLYRWRGGGVCATTYSWQWLLFELSNETGDYRVILQDNDKDGDGALSGEFAVPRHSSASASSAARLFAKRNPDWIRAESGSEWATGAADAPATVVGSALDQLGWPLFVNFRITWHRQNNGADNSKVAKWQLSGAHTFIIIPLSPDSQVPSTHWKMRIP